MNIIRTQVPVAIKKHGVYRLPDRIRRKSFSLYDEVCVLCLERWKHFAEWEPTTDFPDWVESTDSRVRLDGIQCLGVALRTFDDGKREDDYLYASIFQSDVKTLCKGLKYLYSKPYLRAWESFYKKIVRFGSYERVFLAVTQLYEEYLKFCVEVLQKRPILRSVQNEYPDFIALLNAAIWCVKYEIDPAVYVKVMYNVFKDFDQRQGGNKSELFFSCKHVGSTSTIRPSSKAFQKLNQEVHPWREVIRFLGLNDSVRIECNIGIPLGFKLCDRHVNAGGLMSDITQIQDEYYWAGGVRYKARF